MFFNEGKYNTMDSQKIAKFIELWRDEYAVFRTIDEQICVDKNGEPLPWYTYPAIEYLQQFDYSRKQIGEFGCGYSCAFWAKRAQNVKAVENDEKWFERWQRELQLDNLEIVLSPQDETYENSLDKVCDVIVIDGIRRLQCAQKALSLLADGGMIIVDDSDRVNNSAEYRQMIKLLKDADLLQIDFYGCCPMNNFTKATSLFLRRNFNFPLSVKYQPTNGIGNLWGKSRRERKEFYKNNK